MTVPRTRYRNTINTEIMRLMWLDGKDDTEIARAFGVSKQAVQLRRQEIGLASQRSRAPMDEARLRKLWDEGLTIVQIAEALERPTSTVQVAARKLELPSRPRGRSAATEAQVTDEPDFDMATLAGRLLATKGKWAELAKIAAAESLPLPRVQQLYHRARSGR